MDGCIPVIRVIASFPSEITAENLTKAQKKIKGAHAIATMKDVQQLLPEFPEIQDVLHSVRNELREASLSWDWDVEYETESDVDNI
jgi:hypothetical protein